MTLRSIALIACTASTVLASACSDHETAKAEAPAPHPAANTAETPPAIETPAPAPVAQTVQSFAGTYEGPFDGGPGTVTVTGAGPTYRANIVVVGEGGCVAEIGAQARASGDVLSFSKTHPDAPEAGICEIEMTRSGATLSVRASGCDAFHGMGCDFTGTARKTQ